MGGRYNGVRLYDCGLLRYLYQWWQRQSSGGIDRAVYFFHGRHFGQRHVCWNCGIHHHCMPLRHSFRYTPHHVDEQMKSEPSRVPNCIAVAKFLFCLILLLQDLYYQITTFLVVVSRYGFEC